MISKTKDLLSFLLCDWLLPIVATYTTAMPTKIAKTYSDCAIFDETCLISSLCFFANIFLYGLRRAAPRVMPKKYSSWHQGKGAGKLLTIHSLK